MNITKKNKLSDKNLGKIRGNDQSSYVHCSLNIRAKKLLVMG